MHPLPGGTITLLFTDIEGSTQLLRRLDQRYEQLLDAHHRLLERAITDHHGLVIDTQGDAIFAVFPRAFDAIDAVVVAQRAIAAEAWPDGVAVRVRMGLHTGEPTIAGRRYIGLAVHQAARIGAAAHGGQVLLSEATRALLRDALPEGVTLRDLGQHHLKDIAHPEQLFQVIVPGLPDEFPPPRTLTPAITLLPMAAPPAPTTPLVGRVPERALLRKALDAARAGHGGLVLIGGEAGIGKTTLAERLCHEATAAGATILIGRCYDLTETPPYGPWRELFARGPAPGNLPRLPAAVQPVGGVPVTNQEAVTALVREHLTARTVAADGQQHPLVLLLDDLHWADPASLDLLREVARDLLALPVLILVTYRADEVQRGDPLYASLPLLVREARATRLDLHPLTGDEIVALIDQRYQLPADDTHRLANYLRAHAEGNPFFADELLRMLEEEGALGPSIEGSETTSWSLGSLDRFRVPPLVQQVVDGRLARLGEEARDLLAIAAVIGQQVDLTLWQSVAETEEGMLLDVVERAIAARLLRASDGGDAVQFAHALTREALYEGLLPLRRRVWHRRVADTLLAVASERSLDPDIIADHLRRASDPRAAEWLVRAGDRAQHDYALLTAAARFEAALALLESRGQSEHERAMLLYRLARMRRYADPTGALTYLDDAAALATEAGDPLLAAYAGCAAGYLRCTIGAIRRGLDELEQGIATLDQLPADERDRLPALQTALSDPPSEHHYRGALASWLALVGRYGEARVQADRIVEAATGQGERGAGVSFLANAWRGLASAYAALGQPVAAQRAYTTAAATYRAAGHHYQVGNSLVMALYESALPYAADDLTRRCQLATEAEEAWRKVGDALPDLPSRLAWLPLLTLEGEWDEATTLAEQVRAPGARTAWRPFASSFLAQIARHQGQSSLAWSLLQERLPGGPETEPGNAIFLDAQLAQRLAADLALDAGDLPTAHAWLEAHDRWLAWGGTVLGRAEGALGWARWHQLQGDLDRARDRALQALEAASGPRQPLALLAAEYRLGEIELASASYLAAEEQLDAALELANACKAHFARALILLSLTELCAATERPGEARALLNEARTICTPLRAESALAHADRLLARIDADD